jgi:hypothetical protein
VDNNNNNNAAFTWYSSVSSSRIRLSQIHLSNIRLYSVKVSKVSEASDTWPEDLPEWAQSGWNVNADADADATTVTDIYIWSTVASHHFER